jgi:hypothetical protein
VLAHERMGNEMEKYVREQAACLSSRHVRVRSLVIEDQRAHTANAVIVFRVSRLISAGMKARIKLGTLYFVVGKCYLWMRARTS